MSERRATARLGRLVTGVAISLLATSASGAITGSDSRAITGGDSRAITGGDSRAITGGDTRLILLGRISVVESDFLSVLGQSIFLDRVAGRFGVGAMVAVYGSINLETSSIVDATVIDAGQAGFSPSSLSYLTGIVDAVDYENGRAIVSGLMVDYSALLSLGVAPSVGDQVAVSGRHYSDLGMLVAEP